MLGRNLPVQGVLQFALDLRCDLLHLSGRNGTFIAGLDDSCKQLAFIEHLMGSVFFDNNERQTFHHLVRGESFLTGQAFTSAANAVISFRGTGVNDTALRISANRTFHGLYLQNIDSIRFCIQ